VIIAKMDRNHDTHITMDEFIAAAHKNKSLMFPAFNVCSSRRMDRTETLAACNF
jgi:hypothetical protein